MDQHCWQVMGGPHSDLAANLAGGGAQLALPTGVKAAPWFLEGTHQGTRQEAQDRKCNLGRRPGRSRCSAVAGKVQTLRPRCFLLRAGVPLCLCQALSDQGPGMDDASFQALHGALATSIGGPNLFTHLLYDR